MELSTLLKSVDENELRAFARLVLRKTQKVPTILEAYERTRKEHWLKSNAAKSRWAKEVDLLFTNHIRDQFGHKEVDSITAKDVRAWHKSKAETPVNANRALSVLSKIFTFLIEDEVLPQGTNPCAIVKRHPERQRTRVPTESELKLIVAELLKREHRQRYEVAFSFALLFSGARPSFLERAKKSDLRVEGNIGVLELQGKTGIERVLIPGFALQKIQSLNHTGKSLFGIKHPSYFLKTVFRACGCEDLWGRDFRKAFASLGRNSGVSMDTIGGLLNHSRPETTARYGRLTDRSKIEAVGIIGDVIEGFLDLPRQLVGPTPFAGHQQTSETLSSGSP